MALILCWMYKSIVAYLRGGGARQGACLSMHLDQEMGHALIAQRAGVDWSVGDPGNCNARASIKTCTCSVKTSTCSMSGSSRSSVRSTTFTR